MIIGGKSYISSKRASQLFGYTNDYLGQLSRSGKIASTVIGRDRFIEFSSLSRYVEDKKILPKANGAPFPGVISNTSDLSVSKEPSKFDLLERSVALLSLTALIAFFTITPIGRNGLDKLVTDLTITRSLMPQTASVGSISNITEIVGRSLKNIDKLYLGVLDNLGDKITELWNLGRSKVIAYVNKSKNDGVVNETKIINSTTTISVSNQNAYLPGSDASPDLNSNFTEEQIKEIARDVVSSEIAHTIDYANSANGTPNNVGIVVNPSTGDSVTDSKLIESIRDNFSDEVNISLDKTRKAGVIKPIFKSGTDDSYVFVLVPIQDHE